jgi:hypothetical protein
MSGFQLKSGGIVAKRKTKGTASAVPFIYGLDSGQPGTSIKLDRGICSS